MSGVTAPLPAEQDSAGAGLPEHVRSGLVDTALVTAWFLVLALIGAVLWWQLAPLAEYTRTADNATMDEQQLAQQFSATGWFVVIGGIGGLLSGAFLLVVRRRNPILMVLLVGAGGALATWVMLQTGLVLGPPDPSAALPTAVAGDKVPLQLKADGTATYFVWSIAALVGGLLALWFVEAREDTPGPEHQPFGQWSPNQG